jgi:hypothetical protein
MGLPFAVEGDQETVALLTPGLAVGFDGAAGTLAGTTAVEAVDGGLVPTAL